MNSAIYVGHIRHRRHHPATHAFSYRMFQPLLDLDELDEVFDRRWLWSVERPNLASMRRRDFHGDPDAPLACAVRDTVSHHLGRRPTGPIRLLAHLRYLGYSFNPVSFYYGYLEDGRTLDWVLAEITNTPWRQRHGYVLPVADAKRRDDMLEWTFDKQFHVSPFLPMQRRYRWRLQIPAHQLRVHMAVSDGDRQSAYRATDRMLRTRLLQRLGGIRGRIVVEDAFGLAELGRPDAPGRSPIQAHVTVHRPDFYRQVALNGSVGAGESFMDGDWDCDDLVALVQLLVRNRELLDRMERGLAALGGWLLKSWHALRRNTRTGSRRNIAAHYDLGNDLFSLFLDRNLMYSSAVFAHPAESLEVAATRKLDRICQKLALQPTDHVVEIGTGWGGFALHAARHYGCRVTTTTISRKQHALARERVAAAGLRGRVSVLLEDYRDLEGRYDKLVSIEMVEAIGHQYLDTYLSKCASLLHENGLALIQAITIEDHRYRQALQSVDFIKRHIFPGSFIPSISAIAAAMARSTDLRLVHMEDIGPSYALTLRAWRERFAQRLDEVRALGYDERFVRMWEFYLCYCEGGFIERSIGDAQLLLARPGNRRGEYLPDLHRAEPACT